PHLLVETGEGRLDRDGGPNGSVRIVLMRPVHPEDTDDGIPDELLDVPALLLHRLTPEREVASPDLPHHLVAQGSGQRSGVDEVAEQDSDELPAVSGVRGQPLPTLLQRTQSSVDDGIPQRLALLLEGRYPPIQ